MLFLSLFSYDSSSDEEPSSFNEYTNFKGIENVGNTCYMNAALQCIAQCDFIKKIYLNQQFLDVLKKKSTDGVKFLLTKKFARFIRKLSASLITETFAPYSLKEIFAFYHPNVNKNIKYYNF